MSKRLFTQRTLPPIHTLVPRRALTLAKNIEMRMPTKWELRGVLQRNMNDLAHPYKMPRGWLFDVMTSLRIWLSEK